jgi:hypothetical protein
LPQTTTGKKDFFKEEMLRFLDRSHALRHNESQLLRLLVNDAASVMLQQPAVPPAFFLPVSSDLKVPVELALPAVDARASKNATETHLMWLTRDSAHSFVAPAVSEVAKTTQWPINTRIVFLGMGRFTDAQEQPVFAISTGQASAEVLFFFNFFYKLF